MSSIKNTKNRMMSSKFRLSSHDLEIERGRHGNKSVKEEECYCKFCKSNKILIVEDEFHFLMICPLYRTRRDSMIRKISDYFPNFSHIGLNQQFIWLLSQEDDKCTKELSKLITQSMNWRSKELQKYIIGDNKASHTNNKHKNSEKNVQIQRVPANKKRT